MHTLNILRHLVEHHLVFTYLFILFVTIFEGEIMAICAGILVLLGALNFWIALVCIFIGGMIKTVLGYFLGKFLFRRFQNNKFLLYVGKKVHSILPHFDEKPFWSIFISKFIMMNHLVILYAGYKNINFREYMKAEVSSTLFWAPGLMLLGYFFSYTAISFSHEIWQFSLIVLILVIILVLLDKLFSFAYKFFEEFYHDHGQQ